LKYSSTQNTILLFCSLAFITLAVSSMFYFGMTMPIYTDEVGWGMASHRAIIDDYTRITLTPQCGDGAFARPLPWLWYIPAWINHLFYTPLDSMVAFRGLGMLMMCAWFLLTLALLKRVFNLDRFQLTIASAFILMFFSMDQVFLLLVMARPENAMLLQANIAMTLAVYASAFARKRLWIIAGVFCRDSAFSWLH